MMDAKNRRANRRSHPNLQLLTVTPLTPNFPLPATNDDPADAMTQESGTMTPKSYLEPRSLPQTPSILSRSSSRTRQRPASRSSVAITDLASAAEQAMNRTLSPLAKRSSHHRSASARALRAPESTGWMLQTASTLTTSTAESKGQAWLATRTSSTSLVDATPIERFEMTYVADDEFSSISHRYPSRSQSRYGSRGTSRRGSRVGIITPLGFKSPGERDEDASSYFDAVGVDFVDVIEDEAIEDDSEMRRLVWGKVGGWVDWAVGWMDFREDIEDESLGETPEESQQTSQQDVKDKEPLKRLNRRRHKALHYESVEDISNISPAPENQGIMGDAAWLFGLAKSSLA